MSSEKKPTTQKIARLAGVSQATVSRVFNKTAGVSPEVKERVLAAARELGYPMPARSALSLSSSPQPGIVGVVITDLLNPFFAELVRGVQDEARADGFGIMLYDTAEDLQAEQRVFSALSSHPVDAVIVCASRLSSEELISFHESTQKPMVVLNRLLSHPSIPCILIDQEQAVFRAANHLLDLGHTRIAFLAGPGRTERQLGLQSALQQAGLPPMRADWAPTSAPTEMGGFQAMSVLLSLPREDWPTAVMTYNDMMAVGALHALRMQGVKVPEEMSLIGFDDISLARHMVPPLTTIKQPKNTLGRLAMQTVRRLLRGDPLAGQGYIQVESPLVVRQSTAPPLGVRS